jgi:biotin-(acetyl-CoA carboxylase) ligase
VQSGTEVIEGMAEELDGDGHLLLRDAEGILRRLSAGEVTVVAK